MPPPPGPGPEPGTVPITFRGADGYVVRSTTRGGQVVQCTCPCTLHLSPGPAHVEVVGQFSDNVQVPNHPASAEVSFKRKGLLITGIVLAGIGVGSLGLGVLMKSSYEACKSDAGREGTNAYNGDYYEKTSNCSGDSEGTAFLVIGALLGAAGVGMLIPGAVSRTAITMSTSTTEARPLHNNILVGFGPRRDGGGTLSVRLAF